MGSFLDALQYLAVSTCTLRLSVLFHCTEQNVKNDPKTSFGNWLINVSIHLW